MIRLNLRASLLFTFGFIASFGGKSVGAQSPDAAQELQAIFANPAVQQALERLETDDAETMRTLMTLTEIPAPPFAEQARGLAFRDMLVEAGVDPVYVDDVGNVIALGRGSGGPGAAAPR